MIHFTPKAIAWIRQLRESMKRPQSGLRIAITGGGSCAGYEYFVGFEDEPTNDDHRFQVDDFWVYVDPVSYREISDATIDFVDSTEGSGFIVKRSESADGDRSCCCFRAGVQGKGTGCRD